MDDRAEIVGYRWSDIAKVNEGLKRTGQKAAAGYEHTMQRRHTEGPRPGRIEIED